MISEKQQEKQKRTQKDSKRIPKCPDVDTEYGSCIMQCSEPCSWGLRRWAEHKRTGRQQPAKHSEKNLLPRREA